MNILGNNREEMRLNNARSPDTNAYRALAYALVTFHFAWTLLVFGGAIAMFIYPQYAFMEILVLSVTLLAGLPFRFACPITLMERRIRRHFDPSYENHGSFMATYTNKMFGTHITTKTADIIIGIFYVIFYTYAVVALIYYR